MVLLQIHARPHSEGCLERGRGGWFSRGHGKCNLADHMCDAIKQKLAILSSIAF